MMTSEVGEILVRIDPSENWYVVLARAAAEAEKRGLGLRLVLPAAPQSDPHRADGRPGADSSCRGQHPRNVDGWGEEGACRAEDGEDCLQ